MKFCLLRCKLAAMVGLAMTMTALVGASTASASLAPFYSASGSVDLSQNGYASNSGPVTKPIVKPSAGATVRAAFLFAAGTPGYTPQSTDITLDGTPVTFTDTPVTASFGAITREADVTSIVAPVINAAAPGNVNLTVNEVNNTYTLDGEALVVVFNDPAVSNNTVALEYGTEDTTGDTFNVGFAQPINLGTTSITFAIGDSYSYQGVTGSPVDQYSLIDVNGTPPVSGPDPARLTTSAGGQDDEVPGCDNNGCLLTVGGVGDNPANPVNPLAIPSTCGAIPPYTCDDELYTLGSPFVQNGNTSMSVYTLNPSNDDDIFYASFQFNGLAAVVGEGITLAPPTQTDNTGSNATVTAHVQDTNGNPVTGTAVTFTINSGPNAGKTFTTNTDGSGNASYTYSSSSTGTDNITASFVDNMGNTDTSNGVTVTWMSPVSGCSMKTPTPPLPTTFSSGGNSIHIENVLQSSPLGSGQHLVIRSLSGPAGYFALGTPLTLNAALTSAYCRDNTHYPLGSPSSNFNEIVANGAGVYGTSQLTAKPGYTIHVEIGDYSGPSGPSSADTVIFQVRNGSNTVVWQGEGNLTAGSETEAG